MSRYIEGLINKEKTMNKDQLEQIVIKNLEEMREGIEKEQYYICFLSIVAYRYISRSVNGLKLELNYDGLVEASKNKKEVEVYLDNALKEVEKSHKVLSSIFKEYSFFKNNLGSNKNEIEVMLIKFIEVLEMTESYSTTEVFNAVLAFLYTNTRKTLAEHTTPNSINKLIRQIILNTQSEVEDIYDPTVGLGNTLVEFAKNLNCELYGQEINGTSYNIAKLNLITNGIELDKINLQIGNVLEDDNFRKKKFDVVVGQPPFATKWSAETNMLNDERYANYGVLAPKSKADFPFLQNMIYHLKENGIMIAVVSQGVLFRGGSESKIRRNMIESYNYIDAVIGLPGNLMANTAIPVVLMVFKKNRKSNNIQFIDASKKYKKNRFQNTLLDEHIEEITSTYVTKSEVNKYSHIANFEEVRKNDFNLNISRYVDTYDEEKLDISEIVKMNKNLKKSEIEVKNNISTYLESFEGSQEYKTALLDIID